jgi:trehalose/maltose hydrolase-like predicted phosphorylase
MTELGYKLPKNFLEKNFDYYYNRCSHGSTLSKVVHSHLASLIGKHELAWELFLDALKSDYNDIQGGTTAEGIHMGVMTGTTLLTVTMFLGFNFHTDTLSINPALPKHFTEMKCKCTFRGVEYQFNVNKNIITATAGKNNATLAVKGKRYTLNANEEVTIKIGK